MLRLSSTPVSNTRALALIGLFSALYIVTAAVIGTITGPGLAAVLLSGGYPEHILRGIFMAGVVISTRRMWSATAMGIVCGLVFLLTVPAPADALYLFPATVAAGIVYDLTLRAGKQGYAQAATSKRGVLLGAGVSGIAESIVALSILTFIFHYPFVLVSWLYWTVDIPVNFVLSVLGASIAAAYMLRRISKNNAMESVSLHEPESNS